MATFADLPAELLAAIFRLACEDRISGPARPQQRLAAPDRAALACYSLVHSSWTRPAQALLLAYVFVAVHLPCGSASPMELDSVTDFERDCRRHPTFADAIRTVRFSNGAGIGSVPVLPRCETLLPSCPRITALRIDRSLTLDWNALAPTAGQLRSLAVLSPFSATEARPSLPAFPALEELTINLSELRHLISRNPAPSLSHRNGLTRQPAEPQSILFPALTALNLTSHKASDHAYHSSEAGLQPAGTDTQGRRGRESEFDSAAQLPRLSAVACPLVLKDELDQVGLPKRIADRVLWHVGWQDFVDYMPPWRTFASTIDEDEPEPAASSSPRLFAHSPLTTTTIATAPDSASHCVLRLQHLYILPLPYDPLPPHFLEELTRRIASDPSLHALSHLWLPKRGWEQHILPLAAASNPNWRSVTFWRTCAGRGIAVKWVAGGYGTDAEGDSDVATVDVDMPEEYRLWVLEQDNSRVDA